MLVTVVITLASLLAAFLLGAAGATSPAALAHLGFAVGIVPLIFAAMTHFVPVLTRSGDPHWLISRLPNAAQLAGLLAVAGMAGEIAYGAVFVAAAVDLFLAAILLGWMIRRARRTLGQPHPGWRWYALALGCLIIALAAILAMWLWPAAWTSWRLFHLHLNTLGLVGLAAFGTLPVLLPTALGLPDPGAAGWLRRQLAPMCLGLLAVAGGAAWAWPLAVLGAPVLLFVVAALLWHWSQAFGLPALWRDGVGAALLVAVAGALLCLLAGVLHVGGGGRLTLAAWAACFLLPLVSGALSQLLPVWRWPGRVRPARLQMRQCLARGGQLRALLFFLGGALFLLGLPLPAGLAVAGGFAAFLFRLARAARIADMA